ncbi:MAG: hypothetical protein M1825_004562 [Sarcosagium campestre]|nr:MAG: hypothetical protein M1825_004562 [Sarcosagium campestre]
MRPYVQVLSTPTADTPGTTLLLHFDDKRYIFGNVAEGTQRASIERSLRIGKVAEIFLTGRTEWANNGGLVGLVLTLAAAKTSATASAKEADEKRNASDGHQSSSAPQKRRKKAHAEESLPLTIHGGINLTHMLATTRRFVFRQGLPLRVVENEDAGGVAAAGSTVTQSSTSSSRNGRQSNQEASLPPSWSDSNIRVWTLPLTATSQGSSTARLSQSRKRSLEESEGISQTSRASRMQPSEREAENKQVRDYVVAQMFDSDWSMKKLEETFLSAVDPRTPVFVRDELTGAVQEYVGPRPSRAGDDSAAKADVIPDVKVLVRTAWPGSTVKSLPPTSPSKVALSYIIKNHYQRGRFLPQKAKALKVQEGRNFGQLANGKSVVNNDGEIVTPDMVLEEGKEGGGFAVLDIPSTDYVETVIDRNEWRSEEVMNGVGAFIWLLGRGVGQDPKLREFIRKMPHVQHLVSSPDYCPNYLSFDSSAAVTINLHQIDGERFRVPRFDNAQVPQPDPHGRVGVRDDEGLLKPLDRGQKLFTEPAVEIQDDSRVPYLNTAEIWKACPRAVLELAEQARAKLNLPETKAALAKQNENLPGADAEIITLGTGSSTPAKYRNVSATLLRVPGRGSYLFDCGENTLGQLRRMYSPRELAELLRDLRVIWISHLHADHHLGLTSVIKAWSQEVWAAGAQTEATSQDAMGMLKSRKHLVVISASHMISWLKEYAMVEDFGYEKIIPLEAEARSKLLRWDSEQFGFHTGDYDRDAALVAATGLSDFESVPVRHCFESKACSLTFSDGFKFSYSGDCRPGAGFAEMGRGSTVLLHEATFDDEMHKDAKAKRHSTTSEAIGVGIAMGARRVLLTHFSQRYAKIPVMENMEGKVTVLEGQPKQVTAESAPSDPLPPFHGAATGTGGEDDTVDTVDADGAATKSIKMDGVAQREMKVGVAFDYMRVKVGEINQLEYFTPALQKLLEDAKSDADDETAADQGQ